MNTGFSILRKKKCRATAKRREILSFWLQNGARSPWMFCVRLIVNVITYGWLCWIARMKRLSSGHRPQSFSQSYMIIQYNVHRKLTSGASLFHLTAVRKCHRRSVGSGSRQAQAQGNRLYFNYTDNVRVKLHIETC